MEFKRVLAVALVTVAVFALMPFDAVQASDSSVSPYESQLDEYAAPVYGEVCKATEITDATREFTVSYNVAQPTRLFNSEDALDSYAYNMVRNALTAVYLTEPMVPYIWDFPVSDVKVTAVSASVGITSGDDKTMSYALDRVTFSLSVPEWITADSMNELKQAINDIKIVGNNKSQQVVNIMEQLDKLAFEADGDGEISNIYDALVKKKTTSAGVSQAFIELCSFCGVPAITVAGENVFATNESKDFWNYVYLEGELDGGPGYAWYIVDPGYCNGTGIAGYSTPVEHEGRTYSMSSAHNVDLSAAGLSDLEVPQVNKDKYVQVGGPTFLEQHGEKLLLLALAIVLGVGMYYAIRTGNY